MKRYLVVLVLVASGGLTACGSSAPAATEKAPSIENSVREWASIIEPAVHNTIEPRPPGSSEVLHTIVHLAVYDAVTAIEGGSEPYATAIKAPKGADVNAAVATAAYRAARGRVAPSQFPYLDEQYGRYMDRISDSRAKADGIEVGETAAAGLLTRRADDGFDNTVTYRCSSVPPPVGEFEPNGGCGTEPVDAKGAQIRPFTFDDPARFRPDGPDPLTSDRWVEDFDEVKAFGRTESSLRTPEQTDVAYFWSEHGYVHWNRNLIGLAVARHLDVAETARLFAMAHTAGSDAVIAGLEAKYFYRTWRPRTAVPRAGDDGNPRTEPDATWTPLLSVNHPEYPAGHGFFSTAVTEAVGRFFGTSEVPWTIVTSKDAVPPLIRTERTYENLGALIEDVTDARVWGGLHYRNTMREGAELGRIVARHVLDDHFRRTG